MMRIAAANVAHLTAAALYVNRIKPATITHSLTQSLPPGLTPYTRSTDPTHNPLDTLWAAARPHITGSGAETR